MSRPRLPIGTYGQIGTRTLGQGRVEARTRYRDWDGKSRLVQATAPTVAAAERALKVKLSGRSVFQIDVIGPVPSIAIRGTIVCRKGAPPTMQDHPKTARSRRTVAIPPFTAEAVRQRLAAMADHSPDALLFCTRNGTPLTMYNVRRQLRHVLDLAGIEGVTPHMFRRTVATAVNDNADVELAAELLGHKDSKITIQHYIRRREMVNPATAAILEEAFKPDL